MTIRLNPTTFPEKRRANQDKDKENKPWKQYNPLGSTYSSASFENIEPFSFVEIREAKKLKFSFVNAQPPSFQNKYHFVHEALNSPATKYVETPLKIGKGSCGAVTGALDKVTGCWVALKRSESVYFAKNERSILQKLAMHQTPHRLNFVESYREDASEVIVTDLIPERSIEEAYLGSQFDVNPLTFNEIITIARQALEFLVSLEDQRIVHGDIKPANMIFERGIQYLTFLDYNLSLQMDDTSKLLRREVQTLHYRCPELILKGLIHQSIDIWSLGCVLYQLLTNEPLFHHEFYYNQQNEYNPTAHLHVIAAQIGLPSRNFLEKYPESKKYYNLDPTVSLKDHVSNYYPSDWRDCIEYECLDRGIPSEEIALFIGLLEGMLRYENRPSPRELLKSPLFHQDVHFYLSSPLPYVDKISIFSVEDILSDSHNEPVLSFSPFLPITRTCFHIPKDPWNLYLIVMERLGVKTPPLGLTILDGQTIDLNILH